MAWPTWPDGLGAAHWRPARFLAVLKDPHVGSFGVVALVMALLLKLVGLMLAARHGLSPWALLLLPAWARFGALAVVGQPAAAGQRRPGGTLCLEKAARRFLWLTPAGPAGYFRLADAVAAKRRISLALWLWRRFCSPDWVG